MKLIDTMQLERISGGLASPRPSYTLSDDHPNLLELAGLNSSGAFTQIDSGNYSYAQSSAASYNPSVFASIGVGIAAAATDCFGGVTAAAGVAKVGSIISPKTSFPAKAVAAIGCAVGIAGGLYHNIKNL